MQQRISSTTGQETVSDDLDQKPSSKKDTLGINQFYFWPKEDQLKAFWAWLPRELADISGIDWTTISSEAMGYCVRTVRDSPDTACHPCYRCCIIAGTTGVILSP